VIAFIVDLEKVCAQGGADRARKCCQNPVFVKAFRLRDFSTDS
jgi:hypothetical protein